MSTLSDALQKLAAVPPKSFARERDALARSLRKDGDKDAAAEVKSRRAPTVPVWIVNRLALEHPDDVDAYLDAADRVKSAQLGRAGSMSSATAAHRAALERLRSLADTMLRAAKIATGPDKVARIQNTLAGAAANADTRKALRAGLIEQELMAPGFDVFGGAQPVAARATKEKTEPAQAKRKAAEREDAEPAADRRKREAEEAEAREREEREAAHRERVEAARAALRESESAAKTARERVEEAEARLHEAQERVKEAREAVGEATAEARHRDADVKRAHAALEAAQRAKT